ncbi:MAG: Mg2 transporter protein CorA family protein [Herbinix sp.]|jgi:magnesium transporter|nr:Mg2 transporter protein CorA family protein [Herbinix sp.]
MFYQIQDEITEIKLEDINPERLNVGIITLEELEQCYNHFGFSYLTVEECKNDEQHLHGTLNSYYDYLFGVIIGINPGQIIKVRDRIGLYIKNNLLIIAIIEDKDDSTRLKLLDLLEHLNLSKITQERIIFGFLERFINEDYTLLVDIEADISEHEDKINERNLAKDFNYQITEIRKKLLLLDNYYQQFIAIGEELEENAVDIFREENLHYFRIFSSRATRLSNNTRMLQEYSVHVSESYHSQLDNDLNKIMKVFTVVTTIFLPLTLIVGWYGMNFTTMPELTWKYGYLYVIILSVVVAIICIFYFKKKKFM